MDLLRASPNPEEACLKRLACSKQQQVSVTAGRQRMSGLQHYTQCMAAESSVKWQRLPWLHAPCSERGSCQCMQQAAQSPGTAAAPAGQHPAGRARLPMGCATAACFARSSAAPAKERRSSRELRYQHSPVYCCFAATYVEAFQMQKWRF